MAKKAASGAGTIRKKTVTKNGKDYTYWEARVTIGRDPITGRQKQKSITGQTQKEVRQKLQSTSLAVDAHTYVEPAKMTVGAWMDTWTAEYLGNVKPGTVFVYQANIKNNIKPLLGDVRLGSLTGPMVQHFINNMSDRLAPASVHLAYKVLYQALTVARKQRVIPFNPAEDCVLPKPKPPKIAPMDDSQVSAFLAAIKGSRYESIFRFALFTGMRESEVLGLTWDCVDFEQGVITVSRQLAAPGMRHTDGEILVPTKNGKTRRISPAKSVMALLKSERAAQTERQLLVGPLWENPSRLVFTGQFGQFILCNSVFKEFKKYVASIGCPAVRFHDLRHTYAVMAIRAGDDIKTVQEALGHASAAFTLNIYVHVTEQMKQESADRMERYISGL